MREPKLECNDWHWLDGKSSGVVESPVTLLIFVLFCFFSHNPDKLGVNILSAKAISKKSCTSQCIQVFDLRDTSLKGLTGTLPPDMPHFSYIHETYTSIWEITHRAQCLEEEALSKQNRKNNNNEAEIDNGTDQLRTGETFCVT